MPILTTEQYERLKKEKELKKAVSVGSVTKSTDSAPTVVVKKTLFTFIYPESHANLLSTFSRAVNINGKEYKFDCVRNKVDTTEKELATYLKSRGYILFRKKEV
jgi:hypothetical protein